MFLDKKVSSFVVLKIFYILGREIKTLINDYKSAGFHLLK
jgi:hypothetical protein